MLGGKKNGGGKGVIFRFSDRLIDTKEKHKILNIALMDAHAPYAQNGIS